jgi:hypothetical protein
VIRLHDVLTKVKQGGFARPTDKTSLEERHKGFSDVEKAMFDALMRIVTIQRGKRDRDLSKETSGTAGMLALHVTGWDWLSPTTKNALRDTQPCVMALTVELIHMKAYREKLMKDSWIGALRMIMELELRDRVKKVQTVLPSGELLTTQEWIWWDELLLPKTQKHPNLVLANLEEKVMSKQHDQQERLALEAADRQVIKKVVAHVAGLACALASSACDSAMSADVHRGLEELVHVSFTSLFSIVRRLVHSPEMSFRGHVANCSKVGRVHC